MRVTPGCEPINSINICSATGVQCSPDIAYGAGYYLVVWSDRRTWDFQIYGARVTPSGLVMEPDGFLIGPGINSFYYHPSIVFSDSNFFVIWSSGISPYRIMGRFVNDKGSFDSDTLRIVDCLSYATETGLAFDGLNYLVAWVEYDSATWTHSVKGQPVLASGVAVDSTFCIAESVDYASLCLRFSYPYYLVTFSKNLNGHMQHCGRYYDTTGQPVGDIFNISNAQYDCYHGATCANSEGKFMNIWNEYRLDNYDIYGNLDVTVGIEEGQKMVEKNTGLRSTVVTNAIEFRDKSVCGRVYDIAGKVIGDFKDGYFDCSNLPAGVYVVMIDRGEALRVVKLR